MILQNPDYPDFISGISGFSGVSGLIPGVSEFFTVFAQKLKL